MIKQLGRDADECVQSTVADCLDGECITTAKDVSYEVLHYQTGLSNPAARIMTNPARPLNIVVALARWVWLMAGNDRLEDIAYYEPKVRSFSDDGLTVPGSNYGARLFNSEPDMNQIAGGVIPRLLASPYTRQAAAVVWQPHDAVRASSDIPCTHGMFFHIRDNRLEMCVTMRSNNAFRILPFNIFEFTMLQEVVAAAIECRLGDYTHWAASMHVYDNSFEIMPTRALAQGYLSKSVVMDPMPWENVLDYVSSVCRLEAQLRHAGTANDCYEIQDLAKEMLTPYWLNIFEPLLIWGVFVKRGLPYDRKWIEDIVPLDQSLFKLAIPTISKATDGAALTV